MRRHIPRCLMGLFFCMVFLGIARSSFAQAYTTYAATYKINDGIEEKWDGISELKANEISGSLTNNELTVNIISTSNLSFNNIYGSYYEADGVSDSPTLSSNIVRIKDSTDYKFSLKKVYGSYASSSNIESNEVNIDSIDVNLDSDSSSNELYLTGGESYSGNTNSNKVTVDNSNFKGIYGSSCYFNGGETSNGNACSNTVTINESTFNTSTLLSNSGISRTSGNSYYNTANIIGNDIKCSTIQFIGGNSYNGKAKNNTVNIIDNKFETSDCSVYGALLINGISSHNTAVIENTVINSDKSVIITGGGTSNGDATSNSVEISKNTIDAAYTNTIFGGYTNTGKALTNSLKISDTAINNDSSVSSVGNLYGGFVDLTGNADSNEITIAQSKGNFNVYGGYIKNELYDTTEITSANSNTINIDNCEKINDIYGGYLKSKGNADKNTISISNSSVGSVYGGYISLGGTTASNIINIKDVKASEIYGGNLEKNKNQLFISGKANSASNLYNFENINFSLADATTESPLITLTDTEALDLSGVCINTTDLPFKENNSITLADATSGITYSGTTTFKINDANCLAGDRLVLTEEDKENNWVNHTVYSYDRSNPNSLILKSNTLISASYIDSEKETSSEGKTITISNKLSEMGNIYGAYSETGDATGATVKIDTSLDLSNTSLIGGYAPEGFKVAGCTLDVSAKDIKVKSVSDFDKVAFTLTSDINSNDTVLKLTDAVDLKDVTIDLKLDSASDNFVLNKGEKIVLVDKVTGKDKAIFNINGDTRDSVKNVATNDEYVRVRRFGYDKTDNNNIAIIGIDDFATGCFTDENGKSFETPNGKVITLGKSASSNIKANFRAADSGSPFAFSKLSDVYGIYSDGSADATGATVNIDSAINYNKTIIHGGYSRLGKVYGNTLNVRTTNAQVKGITDFENLNFVLGADVKNGDTMLKVTDKVDLEPTKNIGIDGTSATGLHVGDSVNLLVSDTGIEGFGSQNITLDEGLTDKNGVVELSDANTLKLNLKSETKNANTKAPAEGIAAAAILLNKSADLTAGALNKSMLAIKDGETDTFAAMNGGHLKTQTGSYVKSNIWNLGFGIGKKGLSAKNPDSTYGLFFQYGKSNFDTHNGNFRGDGDAKNLGFGLMYHSESRNNYYYDGAAYIGKLDAKWSCNAGGYDESATYRGITLGMGHRNHVKDNRVVNVYGKYFFNHTNAMSGVIDGHSYSFDSVDSSRLRLGLRIEQIKNKSARPYFGFAWEHEFSGDAKSTMDLGRVDAPSLKGDTGIVEVGYNWKRGNWDISINAEGSFGKNKGITGAASFYYNF